MKEMLALAEKEFSEGQIEKAKEQLQSLYRLDPDHAEVLNDLGVIAYAEKQLGQAASYFARALEQDRFYREAIINLCTVLTETGNIDAAVPFLSTVAGQFPDDDEIKTWLAAAEQFAQVGGHPAAPPEMPAEAKPLRVLLGTYEVANQSRTLAAALEKNGWTAKTVCYYPNYLKYKSNYMLDIRSYESREVAIAHTREFTRRIMPQFDLFHFHLGMTLVPDYSDLPMLQDNGKKLIAQYWGTDVRILSRAKEMNPYVKVKTADEENIRLHLDAMSQYVDHCLVADYELYEYVRDYFRYIHVVPTMIDLEAYVPTESAKRNDRFLIVHAPTDKEIKGSRYIHQAIDGLKEKYDFAYLPIQGLPHEEAKKVYARADLIVDELHCGSYGLLTVEAMAMGKPVITWISDFMKEKYPPELPVISANPDTIREKIAYALENRDHLSELGRQGRRYVEKYHDMNVVVKKIMAIYSEI